MSGRDRGVPESTLMRDQPVRTEDLREDLQGNSEKSQPIDETKDDTETDFIYRHHVEPRVQLHVPKEETFPIPLKYMDVARTTHKSGRVARKQLTIVGMSMWIAVCQTHGQDSRSLQYCMKTLQKDIC